MNHPDWQLVLLLHQFLQRHIVPVLHPGDPDGSPPIDVHHALEGKSNAQHMLAPATFHHLVQHLEEGFQCCIPIAHRELSHSAAQNPAPHVRRHRNDAGIVEVYADGQMVLVADVQHIRPPAHIRGLLAQNLDIATLHQLRRHGGHGTPAETGEVLQLPLVDWSALPDRLQQHQHILLAQFYIAFHGSYPCFVFYIISNSYRIVHHFIKSTGGMKIVVSRFEFHTPS